MLKLLKKNGKVKSLHINMKIYWKSIEPIALTLNT